MATSPQTLKSNAAKASKTFTEFLQSTPPEVAVRVSDLTTGALPNHTSHIRFMRKPELMLQCSSPACGGPRYFVSAHRGGWRTDTRLVRLHYLFFRCQNCGKSTKVYVIYTQAEESGTGGIVCKLGELPSFGSPCISSRLAMLWPGLKFFAEMSFRISGLK